MAAKLTKLLRTACQRLVAQRPPRRSQTGRSNSGRCPLWHKADIARLSSNVPLLGVKRTFLPATMSLLKRQSRHLGSLMAWPAIALRCPAGTGNQGHFEPFCFFFQADPAQLTYQPCPITRYLCAKSCRNFFIRVSHARPRRVGKKLQRPRNRTLIKVKLFLPADFLVHRTNLKASAA